MNVEIESDLIGVGREVKVSKGLKSKLPEFECLSKSVQCPVCYDAVRDPVSTPCGHDFCSLCVRDYLTYKQQCPSCLKELHETSLFANKSLKNVTECVLGLIPKLEALIKDQTVQAINAVFEKAAGNSPKKAVKAAGTPSRRAILSTPSKPSTSSVSLPEASGGAGVATAAAVAAAANDSFSSPPTSGIVHCPVCRVGVPERNVNLHLDQCLKEQGGERRRESSPKAAAAPRPSKVKKVVYHLLKDAQLKKLLKDEGFSVKGDRKALEWRHKRFTVLWNAQCDSERPPVSRMEVRIQVEKDEKAKSSAGAGASAAAAAAAAAAASKRSSTDKLLEYDRNTDPSVISSKQEAYVNKNKSSFDNLIQQIKHRKLKENVPKNDDNNERVSNSSSQGNGSKPSTSTSMAKSPRPTKSRHDVIREANDVIKDGEMNCSKMSEDDDIKQLMTETVSEICSSLDSDKSESTKVPPKNKTQTNVTSSSKVTTDDVTGKPSADSDDLFAEDDDSISDDHNSFLDEWWKEVTEEQERKRNAKANCVTSLATEGVEIEKTATIATPKRTTKSTSATPSKSSRTPKSAKGTYATSASTPSRGSQTPKSAKKGEDATSADVTKTNKTAATTPKGSKNSSKNVNSKRPPAETREGTTSGKRKKLSDPSPAKSSKGKSTCPVCSQLVPTHLINSHLDYCFQRQDQEKRAVAKGGGERGGGACRLPDDSDDDDFETRPFSLSQVPAKKRINQSKAAAKTSSATQAAPASAKVSPVKGATSPFSLSQDSTTIEVTPDIFVLDSSSCSSQSPSRDQPCPSTSTTEMAAAATSAVPSVAEILKSPVKTRSKRKKNTT